MVSIDKSLFGDLLASLMSSKGVIDPFGRPAHPYPTPSGDRSLSRARATIKEIDNSGTGGIMFAEVMEGNVYIGDDIDDFSIAENAGIASGDSLRFFLTCHAWNTDIRKHLLE